MKYKRKPIVRDVVDALKGDSAYTVQRESGALVQVPFEEFERDYAPMLRAPKTAPKKKRASRQEPKNGE